MRYRIRHTTTYAYGQSVVLHPHLLRLRPRCDGTQHLLQHSLEIHPDPLGTSPVLDLEGNTILRCWWPDHPIDTLHITVTSEVSTHNANPFNFLLDPWATHLPMDYPTSVYALLHPYLSSPGAVRLGVDPVAIQLAQEVAHATDGNTINFLVELTQRINNHCQYQIRATGDPLPPSMTWTQKAGSCRDFVVLFMAACQAVGLAARFVSGYEQGDPAYEQTLHAWAEVYLPGAGWRGYDPTLGLAVSDHHVALVASGWSRNAAPVTGSHRGGQGAEEVMQTEVTIQAQESE